jgi:hypothetical protein
LGIIIKEKTEEEQDSMNKKTPSRVKQLRDLLDDAIATGDDDQIQILRAELESINPNYKKGGYVKSSAQTSVIPGARVKGSAQGSTIPGAKAKGSAEGSTIKMTPMKMNDGGKIKGKGKGSMLSITIEQKPINKKTMNMIKEAEKTGNVVKMKSGGLAKRGYGKARR